MGTLDRGLVQRGHPQPGDPIRSARAPRDTTPYADNTMPTTIRAMPAFIEGSIGIPAS